MTLCYIIEKLDIFFLLDTHKHLYAYGMISARANINWHIMQEPLADYTIVATQGSKTCFMDLNGLIHNHHDNVCIYYFHNYHFEEH